MRLGFEIIPWKNHQLCRGSASATCYQISSKGTKGQVEKPHKQKQTIHLWVLKVWQSANSSSNNELSKMNSSLLNKDSSAWRLLNQAFDRPVSRYIHNQERLIICDMLQRGLSVKKQGKKAGKTWFEFFENLQHGWMCHGVRILFISWVQSEQVSNSGTVSTHHIYHQECMVEVIDELWTILVMLSSAPIRYWNQNFCE